MDIDFNDAIQLLESDVQDFRNKKSFSTIVTLPVIKHHTNDSSKLLDIFDCLHIQTIYRSINCNELNQNDLSAKLKQDKSIESIAMQSKEHLFLALRNVEIKKEYQRQGICTKLIQCLLDFCQKHKINFWIDDVVNDDLYNFLIKQSQTNWNELQYLDYIKSNIHYNDNLDGFETDNLVLQCFYAIFNEQSCGGAGIDC